MTAREALDRSSPEAPAGDVAPEADMARRLYLDLLKQCLTDFYAIEDRLRLMRIADLPTLRRGSRGWDRFLYLLLARALPKRRLALIEPHPGSLWHDPLGLPFDQLKEARSGGRDHPVWGETMVGLRRLDNLQACIETLLADRVPGDLIETGVWRGGAGILMRAVLKLHGADDRTVWLADSFRGVPPPDPDTYAADRGDLLHSMKSLAVPRAEVERNFARYGMLDGRVRFLEGWFKDTLPTAPIDRIALLRLDGDLYESTIQALDSLYAKVSVGGFVIVDDYHMAGCRQATDDFRVAHGVADQIQDIDGYGAYWRKSR